MIERPDSHEHEIDIDSVWANYDPPSIQLSSHRIRVYFNGEKIADSRDTKYALQKLHPPTFYIPFSDIQMKYLERTWSVSYCEHRGRASYWNVVVGARSAINSVWSYLKPHRGFEAITSHFLFNPNLMDACYIDDNRVKNRSDTFYTGWHTATQYISFSGNPEAIE